MIKENKLSPLFNLLFVACVSFAAVLGIFTFLFANQKSVLILEIALAAGFLILISIITVYFAKKAQEHSRQLEVIKQELEKQIHEGQKITEALSKSKEQTQLIIETERLKTSKLESLGILAGGIAHDFNNILTAILGNISLAKLNLKPSDELYQRLSESEKACFRAQALTQQLLTFAKVGVPVKRTTSLKEILKDSAEFTLRGSNVRCELSIAGNLLPVEIDEGQISRVVHNIILNAQQAMPKGGVITVQAENKIFSPQEKQDGTDLVLQGKCIEIVIRDQGTGISKENLKKIFDPYFSTKEKGNGLGLAATYSIVKSHKGHIEVESEVGVGTTFRIYFPASDGKVEKKTEVNFKPRKGLGKILIMDDEESIRDLLRDLLGRLGYATDGAKNGEETIACYQKAKDGGVPFDAIIMDLTIPGGMGGREAIKKLREIDPKVKVIVSSGYSSDLSMSDLVNKDGFNGVLSKPYRFEDLNHILRDLLITAHKS